MSEDGDNMIPKERLDQEIAKHSKTQAILAEQQRELADVRRQLKAAEPRAATADTLSQQIKDLKAELETERAGRGEDATIRSAGFEDAALVRFEHQRSGTDKSIADWLSELGKAPAEAPIALRPMIEARSNAGGGEGGGEGNGGGEGEGGGEGGSMTPGTAGRANAGTATGNPPSAGTSTVTPERLRAASQKGVETGDWAEYRRLRGLPGEG